MVIGVKCADHLATNHVPVMFSKGNISIDYFFIQKKKFNLSINK